MLQIADGRARDHINFLDPVNLIAEKFDPDGPVRRRGRKNFHDIAPHPERPAVKIHIVARILDLHQPPDHVIPVLIHPRSEGNRHILIVNRAAESVNARNAGDDDDIPPLGQRRCRRMAQLVDLLIDRRVLFDIRIRGRDIRFGLVVIVVGDEKFYGVIREKLFELTVELGRQRFIMRDHQRRFI